MKLVKYIIELVIAAACGYCSYYLAYTCDTWEADDSVFYIFAIVFFIGIGIVCVCDVIEDIYYSLK